jgi:hypothetical protein
MDLQSRTTRGAGKGAGWAAVALVACLTLPVAAADPPPPWPPFLLSRQSYPPDVADMVGQTWEHATFHRTVQGHPVRVPLPLYAALVDTPDITAAAARFRGFARDEVRVVGNDWYEATDHRGATGHYRVLARDSVRRVLLSWGENRSGWLGTVKGSALTVLTLEPRGGAVAPGLTAYVRIENTVAAALARVLVVPFGALVDRRLKEGVEIAGRIAEWAVGDPEEFCRWLVDTPTTLERRIRVMNTLPACAPRVMRPAHDRGARFSQ